MCKLGVGFWILSSLIYDSNFILTVLIILIYNFVKNIHDEAKKNFFGWGNNAMSKLKKSK